MNDCDVVRGLDALRRNGRARVSRVLHDEISPALCSAGLMLGLLRTQVHHLPPEGREWMDTLQTAMESAMESARLLSYRTDAALAERCGLQAALEYLALGTDLSLDTSSGLPEWSVAQNETACGIVRDVILAAPGLTARLVTSKSGIILHGGGTLELDRHQREALRRLASLHQLELMYEVPVRAVLFSLGLLKAN